MLHALTVNYSSCLLLLLGFATRKAVITQRDSRSAAAKLGAQMGSGALGSV